jgi:integrase
LRSGFAANERRSDMASLRKRGKLWYYRFTDANGVKCEHKGCTDKRVTEELARAAESKVAKVRAGESDPKAERIAMEARRPIGDHVAEFITGLKSKGSGHSHIRTTRSYIDRIIKLSGIERITDLTLSKVDQAMIALRATGLSARALNGYMVAIKSFSIWLEADDRTPKYSLKKLSTLNVKTDRRRVRRALTHDESARLVRAAGTGPKVFGLSGPDRAVLYALALGTGFRADELRTLTPERFALDSDPPTVTASACYTKNGEEAVQPIAMGLADQLRPWLALRAPGTPVFEGMTDRTADMIRIDLEAAGVAYETASGVVDFHSLRVAYISHLVSSGASVKTCQTLARHATAAMTIGTYAKASLYDINQAVENLPDLTPTESAPECERLAATGTDGQPISKPFAHYLPTEGDVSRRDPSSSDMIVHSNDPELTKGGTLVSPSLDASSRSESPTGMNVPRRAQNRSGKRNCQLSENVRPL